MRFEAPEPDANNLITLPNGIDTLFIHDGQRFEMVVKVYNDHNEDLFLEGGNIACNSGINLRMDMPSIFAQPMAVFEIPLLIYEEEEIGVGESICDFVLVSSNDPGKVIKRKIVVAFNKDSTTLNLPDEPVVIDVSNFN